MLSNVDVYIAIAEEALAESQRLDAAARTPKPNSEPGYIIAWDATRSSFKQSLIAIAFSGMYLEALLYLVGVSRLGKAQYMRMERKTYEKKLSALGVIDAGLLRNCERFREARNDLVHEKAVEPHELDASSLRTAQQEASHAVAFVKSAAVALQRVR